MQYDRSKVLDCLRRETAVFLELWHNYKQATLDVYKKFSAVFLAPMWHDLFPSRFFPEHNPALKRSVPLATAATTLTWVRLAWRYFKKDWEEAMAQVTDLGARQMLLNLRDLCLYFIPLVDPSFSVHVRKYRPPSSAPGLIA